jgi:gas vesicle protein
MRKLFSFLLGLLLGAVVGAAIAVMLAPEAGEDMRRQIQIRMDQVVEEGKRAAADRRAELETQLDQLKKGTTSTS